MAIGILEIKLYLGHVHSLKEKRHQIAPLIHQLRNKFNVSVAETGYQDAWQSAQLTCALVCDDPALAQNILEKILEIIEKDFYELSVESESIEILT